MTRNSHRDREICLDAHLQTDAMGNFMICHCCGLRFNPATTKWRADHIRRHAHGGPSTGENLWPILEACDAGPNGKAANDAREIAKGKRMRKAHFGVQRRQGFRGWRKMNGDVVWK